MSHKSANLQYYGQEKSQRKISPPNDSNQQSTEWKTTPRCHAYSLCIKRTGASTVSNTLSSEMIVHKSEEEIQEPIVAPAVVSRHRRRIPASLRIRQPNVWVNVPQKIDYNTSMRFTYMPLHLTWDPIISLYLIGGFPASAFGQHDSSLISYLELYFNTLYRTVI